MQCPPSSKQTAKPRSAAKICDFADDIKGVRIRKQGDRPLLSPIRPDWASFFVLKIQVPEDFLVGRKDSPPQSHEPP